MARGRLYYGDARSAASSQVLQSMLAPRRLPTTWHLQLPASEERL